MKLMRIRHMPSRPDKFMNTVLIVTLGVILGFTVMYIYHIHTASAKLEKFSQVAESFTTNIDIYYVYNSNCSFCEKFDPVWSDFQTKTTARTIPGVAVTLHKVEQANLDPSLAVNVQGYPTVLFYKDGQYVAKSVGYKTLTEFEQFIECLIMPGSAACTPPHNRQ